ncbi:TonB-dependent hemoglobin/transferrin/lactoferrin family receptor [Roseobacter sp. HKCCD9010]|uniref:TonB-dependent hemoglobin/transferrin/lactoferrin family receptor n=1 Tax=unclassified Roseobacter TaxID=196798 RepID=UPI0014917E2C|nr:MULTISPECIES: TonB-dependent hemoglobin/transferrin/lactoferrin family receptor [unclassified Roseobacter]MBF9051747.1 TonB-dependent hemoglobin/transferrin/lactoferrin family receptor [Rhodobacterales bacterium HKCCD4356]NNV13740.1 TonB-dependent hemoglobin/transferrin/lactoferrin family receptor [Roseobacter sp. HKCCD7357]NNV17765.1 TonB-dependent hemoglobin/transferrin/lactoferrin family receptor [Roseobacter sp. HKCCD8768]NNV27372.1 TonB-dependent hemoglobin/transferrin/lactoferrin famil
MRRSLLLLTSALVTSFGSAVHAQDLNPDLGFDLGTIFLGSALRDDRAILDTPVAASVVEGEELAERQAGDFQELIGDIPGVTINGGPRGISHEPNIRGFRDEQIVLRFDGGRLNFGLAHRGRFFVDPSLVQRVEVVRGGGSTLFGSGALGGVISVETVDAADLLQEGQTIGGRVSLGYSSNGDQIDGTSAVYADYGQLDLLFALSGRQIGSNLEAGDGIEIPVSQIDSGNALFKVGFEPSDGSRFELSYSLYQDDTIVTANSNNNPGITNPVVDRDADVRDLRLSWESNPANSDWLDLSVLFYATRLEVTEARVPPAAARLDETRYDTYGFEIVNRSTFDIGVPVDIVYGFEAFRDTQEGTRNGAPRLSFPNAEATTYGIFAEATFGLTSQLDLIAGARFDSYERDPDDPTLAAVSEEFFSPRIGLSYRPNDNWQIFGNIAQSYRAPTLSELYNSGQHFFGNNFVPNPNLRPEESLQFEIGARFDGMDVFRSGDQLSFGANAYYATVDDYIEQLVDIPGGTTTSSNAASATLYGLEAEVDYDAGAWFLGGGLSIARGENDVGGDLGSIPQDRLTLEAGVRPWEDWELGARAVFAADQDRVPAGGTPSDSYQTLDLYATFAPDSGPLANGTIRFGIDNVFDEEYTIYPNGLSQPGRTFEISATITF